MLQTETSLLEGYDGPIPIGGIPMIEYVYNTKKAGYIFLLMAIFQKRMPNDILRKYNKIPKDERRKKG